MASKRMVFGHLFPETAEDGDQFTIIETGITFNYWEGLGWTTLTREEELKAIKELKALAESDPVEEPASEPKPKKKTTRSKKAK